MIDIIAKRKIWYTLSTVFIVGSLLAIPVQGVRYGIDFTGGTLLEIGYSEERPATDAVAAVVKEAGIASVSIQAAGEKEYLLRMPTITDEQKVEVMKKLRAQIGQKEGGVQIRSEGLLQESDIQLEFDTQTEPVEGEVSTNRVSELRFDSVGPVIGQELKRRAIESLIFVLIAILLYVAWAFRKVSWPVKSWKYGVIAIAALFHDVLITFGAYVWFSPLLGFEVDTAFVAAILTVLGYSVNDTIVVFDRVRENLPRMSGNFATIVNDSVTQTLTRSINTGLSTLLALIPIFFFGGATLKGFVFALMIGIFVGTYSSIFIANPLLVTLHNYGANKRK